MIDDNFIKKALTNSRTIAMVGVSTLKKDEPTNTIRKPSIIVMNYLQEFGFNVIPVNPNAVGKKINGEKVVERLKDIKDPVDIVNVFRPSKEAKKNCRRSYSNKH